MIETNFTTAEEVFQALKKTSNKKKAGFGPNYFPTEDPSFQDLFFDCIVPDIKKIAKTSQNLGFSELKKLLDSNYHEARLCALIILGNQTELAIKYQTLQNSLQTSSKTKEQNKKAQKNNLSKPDRAFFEEHYLDKVVDFYIQNLKAVNSWDLVDSSAYKVLGNILVYKLIQGRGMDYFLSIGSFLDTSLKPNKDLEILIKLASSDNIWKRRVTILTSFSFIKKGNLKVPISICHYHIDQKHHYIQKAMGWILREVGKKNRQLLDNFLIENANRIGGICLSYSLEKHTSEEKQVLQKFSNTTQQ